MVNIGDSRNNFIEPQCQFFVVRKKRLCRMTVRPGRQYCGEHEPLPESGGEVDQRIPCPNDPKHTCYISKLEKHLAKCNARRVEEPPYIEYNVNAPEEPQTCSRIPLKDVPEIALEAVIEKINKIYDEHIKDTITTLDPEEKHHPSVVQDIEQADRTDSSRRHLRQVSRLLQLTELAGVDNEDTCYVEMGAGKGALSYYGAVSWRGPVLAVERASMRHKRDTRASSAHRLRADLAHLVLGRAPCVAEARAVWALAKHLCGVATDYALRCLMSESVQHKVAGGVFATCCHHRCELPGFVATNHLQELGITPEELNIIFSLVSWATCGDGRSRSLPAAAPSDTQGRREDTGRRAKAVLDYGRVLYLRGRGFNARMCYYVPLADSLENVCIVIEKPGR